MTELDTGSEICVLRQGKLSIWRPLQWFICLFHTNELQLRHLLQHLNGKTTAPTGYRGENGKKLELCEKMHIMNFEKFGATLTEKTLYELRQINVVSMKHVLGFRRETFYSVCFGSMQEKWVISAYKILMLHVLIKYPSDNVVHSLTHAFHICKFASFFSFCRREFLNKRSN